ncbi:unnamed protein product [Orchesella dallaii]|uniref:Uncharacterized protein n=1 Tax=Orchesella dallaii TaxID=48710 RepID=A0ABP1QE78_9HEXA
MSSVSWISVFIFRILAFHTFFTASNPINMTTTSPPVENGNLTAPNNDIVQNNSSISSQSSIKLDNETLVVNVNSTDNSTNSNYIIEYKPLVFDSPEDIKTQQEWGGNCTLANWDNCKVLVSWFGNYKDPKDEEIKEYRIDCRLEPVLCLTNSWTVTRCNLLCMSRCNRDIQLKYDKYVSHEGECKAHAHG